LDFLPFKLIRYREKTPAQKNKSCSAARASSLSFGAGKAMKKAQKVIALILRFFTTEPVFSAHSRFVI